MIRIGIDIGGTFTDFAIWRGEAGGYTAVESFKVPSSPPRFAEAIEVGLGRLLEAGTVAPDEEILVVHGTTVSTNAVIERRGPPLALLTTEGFRDILGLQRLRLSEPTNLFVERAVPLVPRSRVYGIDERIEPDGAVLRPLRPDSVVAAARSAIEAGAQAIAVCFLHSYRNPAHEIAAREAIRAAGLGIDVVLSCEVWAQQGEYERAVAAVLNAYVSQIIDGYLGEVETLLARLLPRARLFITRSNGGVMSAREARNAPIHTLLSGPSAGVTAAQYLGQSFGADNVLTMDMGGTSTDLALITDGQPRVTTTAAVGDFPLMMPVTGIEAIGAGGGSVASVQGGVLTVGPRSAGSRPGPACYGRGGVEPTLSDAYLLSGFIDPNLFLGGKMPLRKDLAAGAMAPIAATLGRDVAGAAAACIAVATSNMAAKVLPYLAAVGADPRDLTLLVYGGAGAIHGPLLAEEIGVARVLVPRLPSAFCAFGGLVCDLVHDVVRTVHGQRLDRPGLDAAFAALCDEAGAWLAEQVRDAKVPHSLRRFAEMRYQGQSFQVDVALDDQTFGCPGMAGIDDAFHAEHERLYGHRSSGATEIVAIRVRVAGELPAPAVDRATVDRVAGDDARLGVREVRFGDRVFPDVPVLDRARLSAGSRFRGPVIIEQGEATTLVPPAFIVAVRDTGDLEMTRE